MTGAAVIASLFGVLLVWALLGARLWVVAIALLGYVVVGRPLTPRVWLGASSGLLISAGAYVVLAVAVGVLLTSPAAFR